MGLARLKAQPELSAEHGKAVKPATTFCRKDHYIQIVDGAWDSITERIKPESGTRD